MKIEEDFDFDSPATLLYHSTSKYGEKRLLVQYIPIYSNSSKLNWLEN